MYYDLHIHSCLSPCAEDEMTPNNICNMAKIKGLDFIAITDHNSTRQLASVSKVAERIGLKLLYGTEIETMEEVHVLALFRKLECAEQFQTWIDAQMPVIPNNKEYFGNQILMNENDEAIGEEDKLLLVSLQQPIQTCIQAIHEYGGKVILAHVLDRENSITHQLGFIPQDMDFDGIEIKDIEQKERVLELHPWMNETIIHWFIDSDAHRLVEISEAVNEMDESVFQELWGDES